MRSASAQQNDILAQQLVESGLALWAGEGRDTERLIGGAVESESTPEGEARTSN